MTGEERGKRLVRTLNGLDSRHDCTAQGPHNVCRVGLANQATHNRESMHPGDEISHWCHQPKPEEAPITQQERTLNRQTEGYLDMPQALLMESGPLGKRLNRQTSPFEGFALQTNALR